MVRFLSTFVLVSIFLIGSLTGKLEFNEFIQMPDIQMKHFLFVYGTLFKQNNLKSAVNGESMFDNEIILKRSLNLST